MVNYCLETSKDIRVRICRDPGATLAFGATLTLLLLFGWWLAFIRPDNIAQEAIEKAKTALLAASTAVGKTDTINTELTWYSKDYKYAQEATVLITRAKQELRPVKDMVERAKTLKYRKKCALLADATANARAIETTIAQAIALAEKAAAERNMAYANLQASTEKKKNTRIQIIAISDRLKKEGVAYQKHWSQTIRDKFVAAEKVFKESEKLFDEAQLTLPFENVLTAKGNPKKALELLGRTDRSIGLVTDYVKAINDKLDWLKMANATAKEKCTEAQNVMANCERHLKARQNTTGYLLKAAETERITGIPLAAKCLDLLNKPAENGQPDRPAAYEVAEKAISAFTIALETADKEIAAAKKALANIAALEARTKELLELQRQGDLTRARLNAHHATSEWQEVRDAVGSAGVIISQIKKIRLMAIEKSGLEIQEFFAALALTEQATEAANSAEILLNNLVAREKELERIREEYVLAATVAQQTINEEASNVTSYREHDSDAGSAWDQGVRQLAQAKQQAAAGLYENALITAQTARNQAAGTGSRAYATYQRKEREKEEERQRRAERARRVATDNDSSSSFGDSWGSSNSGGSPFSSSDSNDSWGSSSSSSSDSWSSSGSDSNWSDSGSDSAW